MAMKAHTRIFAAMLTGALLGPCALRSMAQDAGERLPEGLELDRPAPKSAAEKKVERDILGLQQELKAAALAKDRAKVEKLIAADATVTLATGAVTDKEGRIAQILGPGPAFERMDYADQSIRALGSRGAVAFVDSTVFTRPTPDHPKGIIRVVCTYRKAGPAAGYHGWQLVSELGIFVPTKMAEAKP
jgi:hypothetical protein